MTGRVPMNDQKDFFSFSATSEKANYRDNNNISQTHILVRVHVYIKTSRTHLSISG